MRNITLIILTLFFAPPKGYSQAKNTKFFITGQYETYSPDSGLGLEAVYIFNSFNGASISYTTTSSNTVNIYSYETNYITGKIPIPASNITVTPISSSETTYTVSNLTDSKGLVFNDNNQTKAMWIIDHSQHKPVLNQISAVEADDKCNILKLYIDKSDILEYRGTNGQLREIDRRYDISYDILKWDENKFLAEVLTMENLKIGTEVLLETVPNKNTQFTITGDQFGKKFGNPAKLTSGTYEATAVEAYIIAEQHNRDSDYEKGKEDLGGSAPVEIDFYGYANEPAANHFAWYIFKDGDTKNPIARYNDRDMSYTFEASGQYVVRLEAANTLSGCVDTVSVDFSVSESYLKAPNYFSPENTLGQPTEFRFVYKSIVKFKCTIFNRWGNKVYEWTDPSQGWDGRYKGSYVNTGVYYYVVDAIGSDGERYKEGGDINVVR